MSNQLGPVPGLSGNIFLDQTNLGGNGSIPSVASVLKPQTNFQRTGIYLPPVQNPQTSNLPLIQAPQTYLQPGLQVQPEALPAVTGQPRVAFQTSPQVYQYTPTTGVATVAQPNIVQPGMTQPSSFVGFSTGTNFYPQNALTVGPQGNMVYTPLNGTASQLYTPSCQPPCPPPPCPPSPCQPGCPPKSGSKSWTYWLIVIVVIILIIFIIGWLFWWLFNRNKPKSALGGTCSNNDNCESGLSCSNGICKLNPGRQCNSDSDCSTNGAPGRCLTSSPGSNIKICAAAVSKSGGVCNGSTLCDTGLNCCSGTCRTSCTAPPGTAPGGPIIPTTSGSNSTTTTCLVDVNCPAGQVCQYDPIQNLNRCTSLPLDGQRCSINGVCTAGNVCGSGLVVSAETGLVKFCTDQIGQSTQVLDAFNYQNQPYYLLGNGMIIRQQGREYFQIPTDRMMERIVPFGPSLVGVSQGVLYELNGVSNHRNMWHWRIVSWEGYNLTDNQQIYSISSTLDATTLIIQTGIPGSTSGSKGYLFHLENCTGNAVPRLKQTMNISGRSFWVFGRNASQYLVINPVNQTAVRYPDGKTISGIVDGVLSDDGKVFFYGQHDAKTIDSIRLLYVSCSQSREKCGNKGCQKNCIVALCPYLIVARLCLKLDEECPCRANLE